MHPEDAATLILCAQKHSNPNMSRSITKMMADTSIKTLTPVTTAFELVETYLHTTDKQSFCRLFTIMSGMTWTNFVEQLLCAMGGADYVQAENLRQDKHNMAMLIRVGENGEIGRRLNYILRTAKMQRTELAQRAGVGRTTLYRYTLSPNDEEFGVPTERMLRKILQVLPISVSTFCAYPDNFEVWVKQFN